MLSKEQAEAIKQQLIHQIESTFPKDKKAFAISQIQGMNEDQLFEFLRQNKLISAKPKKVHEAYKQKAAPLPSMSDKQAKKRASTASVPDKCVFCSIVNKQLPSYQIDENKSAIAVLEINPVSKGHVLIIPKEHISSKDRLPQQVFSLTKKISRKLKSKIKPSPKDVEIAFSNLFGHEIVNVFPINSNENIASERHHETEENLKKLQKKLEKKTRKKSKSRAKKKKPAAKKSKAPAKEKSTDSDKSKPKTTRPRLWLPRRIP